ncbi:GMC family oxidoreductase [Agromyces aerolatus]|nr:GMC family oxidoreductase N-terminal domain-containing protein [Agromyces sp. LY-1074]MDR5700951.1 GMC family oxidoreductase N-terminal domain-containing protein [Agromyces sp. LY-1074]MDR5707388.1 GMC family oxidoreductase N-terminal domain-containing protein [Agromyces sp. LY-1358]
MSENLQATRGRTIVVGGGTAGCIVAARLSEDPRAEVIVLEAGVDYPTLAATPAGVLDAKYVPMRGHSPEVDPKHDWGLTIDMAGTTIVVPQAKLIGGGSAINGAIALRGASADYREWVEAGNPDWNFEAVSDTFRRLETDTTKDAANHGSDGPFPITRATDDELAPLQRAFIEAARSVGAEPVADFNAPDVEGVGRVPQARTGAMRVSTALSHLNPVRDRPNLEVRAQTEVARVLFDGSRACGVELLDGSVLEADEVILSAGAIMTPAILQRSGVGPHDLLQAHGIEVVADLPVGENLADHCCVPLLAPPLNDAWRPSDFSLQTAWRYSTDVQPGTLDAQLTMFSYLDARTNDEGGRGMAGSASKGIANVAGVGCVINKPRSVGRVAIRSSAAGEMPSVEPRYLSAEVDMAVMKQIVRDGWRVVTASPLAEMLGTPIGVDEGVIADDEALERFISDTVASGYHFTGTAKMADPEHGGVVDQRGNVHGVSNLRVIDASILPTPNCSSRRRRRCSARSPGRSPPRTAPSGKSPPRRTRTSNHRQPPRSGRPSRPSSSESATLWPHARSTPRSECRPTGTTARSTSTSRRLPDARASA